METYQPDAIRSFSGLATYLNEHPLQFGLIPRMAQLALRLPEFFPTKHIPCLRRKQDLALTMHNLQVRVPLLSRVLIVTW